MGRSKTAALRKGPAADTVRWALSVSCQVERARSGHYRVTYDGRYVGTIAGTPSDPRAMNNAKSLIRRNMRRIQAQDAAQQQGHRHGEPGLNQIQGGTP